MLTLTPYSNIDVPHEFHGKKCTPLLDQGHLITVFRDEKTIGILQPCTVFNHKATLVGHSGKVTAMCSSPFDQRYLCSSSSDKIILWFVAAVFRTDEYVIPGHTVIAVELGYVSNCAMSWDHKWIALCRSGEIFIIRLEISVKEDGSVQLDGVSEHAEIPMSTSLGTIATFSPHHHFVLVVVEENMFKIWNVETTTLVYQSTNFGLNSLTSCALTEFIPKIVLGTNKGLVHVYNMTDDISLWKAMTVDITKTLLEVENLDDPDGLSAAGESGCIVFSAQLLQRQLSNVPPHEKYVQGQEVCEGNISTLKSILEPGSLLIVCCNLGISVYNCKSIECMAHLLFSEPIFGTSLTLVDYVVMDSVVLDNLTLIVKTSSKGAKVRVINIAIDNTETELMNHGATVLPKIPLKKTSHLTRQMKPQAEVSAYGSINIKKNASREINMSRQPRSSGYGMSSSTQQLFVPQINRARKPLQGQPVRKSVTKISPLLNDNSEVMLHCGPPSVRGSKVKICDTSGMAIHLAISGNGRHVACSSASSLICILPFSNFRIEKSTNLTGHDGVINSLHFNLDSKWLITGSNDATVKVWDWKHRKCVLNIVRSTNCSSANSCKVQQTVHSSEIIAAKFYYMDRFILLATRGCLELYSHLLYDSKSDNETTRQNYKSVHSIHLPTQQVTCFSAANQLHSYLILCGCSNKSVQVYDMNTSKCCIEFKDVHTRAPHRIHQFVGSSQISHPAAMYDLFLTSSVGDCVKMWDLRSARCIQKYNRHVTRIYTTGLDISPCGRYVAVSSEDKSICLYDTRKPEDQFGKLGGLDDIAMDVAFNPLRPELAVSTLNGYISKYSEKLLTEC